MELSVLAQHSDDRALLVAFSRRLGLRLVEIADEMERLRERPFPTGDIERRSAELLRQAARTEAVASLAQRAG